MFTDKTRFKINRSGITRCERRFWILERCVHTDWNQVQMIKAVMWDCLSAHAFGFRLMISDEHSVSVTDLDDQWDDFKSHLFSQFPDIDRGVIAEVEKTFPSEIELVCWPKNLVEQDASSDAIPFVVR